HGIVEPFDTTLCLLLKVHGFPLRPHEVEVSVGDCVGSGGNCISRGIVGANGPKGTSCPARVSPMRALREE
ncbi:MAG: hypothetical protein V3V11_10125, partial [Vicinamibacteria bacterium]